MAVSSTQAHRGRTYQNQAYNPQMLNHMADGPVVGQLTNPFPGRGQLHRLLLKEPVLAFLDRLFISQTLTNPFVLCSVILLGLGHKPIGMYQ